MPRIAVNYRGVMSLLGRILLALGAVLLIPAGISMSQHGDEAWAFLISSGIAGGAGALFWYLFRVDRNFSFGRREAFVLVSASWVTASVVGALPYILAKGPTFIVDGLFESASGFTTTGASVIDNLEAEPPGILLWRSLTQWLGGMGIIVLAIAILPKLAIGGTQLLGAEVPGPTAEKLTPRIAQTAKALWGIYVLLTGIQVGVLILLGMAPFEAVNHALSTMATGGFSTRNGSVGEFSSAIQYAVTLFMLVAGANFALHFSLLRGRFRKALFDAELRFFLWIVLVATLFLTANLLWNGTAAHPLDAFRLGAFQSVSIITTTGFATADFDVWPGFSRSMLLLLMFVGGCAGSTGGSIKVVRVLIVFKKLGVEIRRIVQPHAVFPVRVGRRAIQDSVVNETIVFVVLFIAIFAGGGLLLGLTGMGPDSIPSEDPLSAFSAAATCLGNVGPGLGAIGPSHTMSQLPTASKLILIVLMIVGRLELYTVLISIYLLTRGSARTVTKTISQPFRRFNRQSSADRGD